MTLASRVSDLAIAIRNKINTMMPRLLPQGGTVGQVLAKSADTDYAVEWVESGGKAGKGWAPITAVGTDAPQEIILPEDNLTEGDILLFVRGIFQHGGYSITGNVLTTVQPAGFGITIVRYGVGEKGASADGSDITVEIADVMGLPEALAAKTDQGHQHNIADVTGLRSELDQLSSKIEVSDQSAFEWTSPTPAQTWFINHNLGRFPTVITVDDSGSQFFGTVVYTDSNNIVIYFAEEASGTAYLAGTLVSGPRNFQWSAPSALTTWEITHNLGRYPNVTVLDSAGSQFFGAVTYVDINKLTISFAYAISGTAYLA